MKKLITILVICFIGISAQSQVTVRQLPIARSGNLDNTARANAQKAMDSVIAVKARYDLHSIRIRDSANLALDRARIAYNTVDSLVKNNTGPGTVALQRKDILHDMTALVPGDHSTNDYVIELNYNREWDIKDYIAYSLPQSSVYFTISAGVLRLKATAPVGDYSIKFAVLDSVYTDTASIDIKVVDPSLCYYVDPTSSGTGVGSKANPYKNAAFTLTADRYYFLKRGTTTVAPSYKDISVSGVTFGAYGQGTRPIWKNEVDLSSATIPHIFRTWNVSNITFRDLDIWSTGTATSAIYTSGSGCTNMKYINLRIRGSSTLRYGLRILTSSTVSYITMNDNEIYDIGEDALNVLGISPAEGFKNNVIGNYFYNTSLATANAGKPIHFSGSYTNKRVVIAHNRLDRSNVDGKNVVTMGSKKDLAISDIEVLIEFNKIIARPSTSVQNGIVLLGMRGAIVRENVISDAYRGIYCGDVDQNQGLQIYGNLVVNSGLSSIVLEGDSADNTLIYHNTLVNYGTGGGLTIQAGNSGVNVRNNIFYDSGSDVAAVLNGNTITEGYNVYHPNSTGVSRAASSILSNPLFIKGGHSNYEIGTNSPAYHSGVVISGYNTSPNTRDIFNDLWYSSPSIGYKEKL